MTAAVKTESRTLADWYPYWSVTEGAVNVAPWAHEAAAQLPVHRRTLDPVAVLSLLSFEFICLDRTLVQGVQRAPWFGGVRDDGQVFTFEAPAHGRATPSPEHIARELWQRLSDELAAAVKGRDRVYVLLSGGMDSRVVSAVLLDLQRTGRLTAPIEARTWGIGETRDVVYASRLAEKLGWAWAHVPLDAESYWANFEVGATFLGAECDPKHLHRMTWFSQAEPNAVVVAGSYGDSIGRAEYSSQHLTTVPSFRPWDRFQLLKPEWRAWAEPQVVADVLALRGRHGLRSEVGFRELERQAHYMRRQLCHPMSIINRWAHVHQAFSAPETFGYMWSLDPSVRTDGVYQHLLRQFAPDLLEVEWARTGGRFASDERGADAMPKAFHRYGRWLRVDLQDRLAALLFDGVLEHLGVFDQAQVRFMFNEWRRERAGDDTMVATHLSMLATLSWFARTVDLSPPQRPVPSSLRAQLKQLPRSHAARARQVVARLSRPYRVGG